MTAMPMVEAVILIVNRLKETVSLLGQSTSIQWQGQQLKLERISNYTFVYLCDVFSFSFPEVMMGNQDLKECTYMFVC